jgi:hypothetical protein
MSDDFMAVELPEAPITLEEKKAAMEEVFGREYAERFNDPVVFLRRKLMSPVPIQFYKREFPLISRTLHLESVYRRRRDFNQDVLDAFAALSAKKLEDILRMLQNNVDRLLKICSVNGATDMADYLHPVSKVVPVIASGSRRYVSVLERLDQAYSLTGSATLNGLFDGNQRAQAEQLCRKGVRAYGAMIRSESVRLRKELQRIWVEANAPIDEDTVSAEKAHDESVAQFDETAAKEAQLDPSSVIPGEQAADMIADIAATSAAASGRKPRARKASPPEEAAGAAASVQA